MSERFSLDTSILIHAADRGACERHERALANHGCTSILSEDMHDGARWDGMTILNPFRGDDLPDPVAALLR